MILSHPPARRRRALARRAALLALALLVAGPAARAQDTAPRVTPEPPAAATAAPAAVRPVTPASPAPAPTSTFPAATEESVPAAAPHATSAAEAPAASAPSSVQPAAPAEATASRALPSSEPAPPEASPAASAQPADGDITAGADEASLPHDLSPWGMFMAADWVVKAVMGGLAFASLVTWTILLAKGAEIAFAKARARGGVRRLAAAQTLGDALDRAGRRWRGPVSLLAQAAEEERRRSAGLPAEGVKERVAVALSRIEAGAGRAITRGTGLLATIGSTAPFVGLFGTVWGIMNSFIGISQANTTNLAVVAPGIAEALLATAIGLVAAIPAVVVYNVFARSISGYRAILSDGSALVMQHLSRQLDRQAAGETAPRDGARYAQAAE